MTRYTVEFHGTAGSWFVHDAQKQIEAFGETFGNGIIHAAEIVEQLNAKDARIEQLEAALKLVQNRRPIGGTSYDMLIEPGDMKIIDTLLTPSAAPAGWVKDHEYHGPAQHTPQVVGAHVGMPAMSRTEAAHAPHGYAPTAYAQKQIDAANQGKKNERDGKQ